MIMSYRRSWDTHFEAFRGWDQSFSPVTTAVTSWSAGHAVLNTTLIIWELLSKLESIIIHAEWKKRIPQLKNTPNASENCYRVNTLLNIKAKITNHQTSPFEFPASSSLSSEVRRKVLNPRVQALEQIVNQSRLRWLERVLRMFTEHLFPSTLFGEASNGWGMGWSGHSMTGGEYENFSQFGGSCRCS